ncbi:DUF2339 domain-containing protein [Fluviicola sp.]|uniref:DUF2339 domain-containing protein n=1 Tax=Fluviicola sp. TaxID=1917219 RepID=UPI0031D6E045
MESDKERIVRLEESYRKLWQEHEDLKLRIKENYAEFKLLRDQYGVEKIELPASAPVSGEQVMKQTTAIPVQKTTAPVSPQVQQPAVKKEKTSWEQFIGEQLLSKIGIAIVLIGVGIGAKYAIDHNMIGAAGRVMAGFIIALVLGGFAFFFREKYRSFSAVLASGSIAVAYFITYAAYGYYQLIPSSVAFGVLLLLVLIAVFLAMYYDMSVIAHLGLLGAYILPPLVSDGSKHISYYLLYMLIINIGMLVISIARKWPTIQYPVIIWTAFIFLFWFNSDFSYKTNDPVIAAPYLFAFFALFVFGIVGRNHWKKEALVGHQLVQLVLVGICYFGAVGFVLDKSPVWHTVLYNIAGVGVYYLNKVLFERENRQEFKRIFQALSLFGISNLLTSFCGDYSYIYVMITGVLLLFWLSKEIEGSLEEVIGIILLALAALAILIEMFIHLTGGDEQPYYQNELFITVGLSVVAMGVTFFLLSKYQADYYKSIAWQTAGVFAFFFLVFTGIYGIQLNQEYVERIEFAQKDTDLKASILRAEVMACYRYSLLLWQYAWIAVAVGMMGAFRTWILKRTENFSSGVSVMGIIFLGAALLGMTVYISGVETLVENGRYWNSFNLAHYVLFAGVVLSILVLRNYQTRENWTRAMSLLLILWMLSLELVLWSLVSGFGAGYKILLSLLWVSFAVSMIVIGIKKKEPIMRVTAMVILGMTILKLFFYDLSTLSTIYKTIVFIAIGGLLLVGAYFYQSLSKQEKVEE